jgi:hypothetical protein
MNKEENLEKISLDPKENQLDEPKEVHKLDEDNKPIVIPEDKKGLVKEMSIKKSPSTKNTAINIIVSLLVVAVGVLSGWGLSQVVGSKSSQSPEEQAIVNKEEIKPGDIYGQETNGFKDEAEGVLLKGGIGGEGSHRILRPGGETQTVYLTSSVIDLNPFVDHKVKVWGETFAAQKANWLMDVGRVEVIELNAEKPFEEDIE